MSAIKDGRYPISLDKERYLLFSLNVIDELQDRAGGYDKLDEFLLPNGMPNFKNLKWLLTLLLNEGAEDDDEEVTERKVGKLIHSGNLKEVIGIVFKAFSVNASGKEPIAAEEDDDFGDEEKNVESEQGN